MTGFSSDIDLQLPFTPATTNPVLRDQLQLIYSALQILQQELSAAKARIQALEDYNIAHP